MKTSKYDLYDILVLPIAFPLIFYALHLRFDLFNQSNPHPFVQITFVLAIIDINKNKLNSFDQKYLFVSTILLFIGRLGNSYSFASILYPTDLIIIVFCIFRSLQLLLQMLNISIKKPNSQYKTFVLILLILPTLFIVIALPPHRGGCGSPNPKRACYANLKTLMGAMEMYELDTNEKFEIRGLDSYNILVKEKYIQSFRMCQKNKKSQTPYYISQENSELCCEVHGCLSDSLKN